MNRVVIQEALHIFRPDGTLVETKPVPGASRGIAVRAHDILLTVPEKIVLVPR